MSKYHSDYQLFILCSLNKTLLLFIINITSVAYLINAITLH